MSEQIPADNATILVVDDIPTNLGVLTIGLGIHGYNVKVAQSGRQALAQVREISPSLILLDVRMPDLDGYEVCERLKADPNLRDIPVIFLSAQGETIDKVRGFQAGGVDYLTKPLQMEEVLAHVDVHITLFQQRKAIEDLLAEQVKAKTAERQQRLMVNALLDSALVVNSTLQLNEVLERILKNVGQVVAHDMAMIILIEGDLGWVASFRSTIPNHWIVPTPKFPIPDIKGLEVIRETRQPLIIQDVHTESWWIEVEEHEMLCGVLGAPIFFEDELLGFLGLFAEEPNTYNEDHAQRLQAFAVHAAIAIKNAQLFKQSQHLAIMQERQRIARELHDSVSQTLFAASAIAQALPHIAAKKMEKLDSYMTELHRLLHDGMLDMRSLLVELHAEGIAKSDLNSLLNTMCESLKNYEYSGMIILEMPDSITLPTELQIVFYRVAYESLRNAARHAKATELTVRLQCTENAVELVVEDNGCGFNPDSLPADHFGIRIMRERAASVGADLLIQSQIGAGSRITLRSVL